VKTYLYEKLIETFWYFTVAKYVIFLSCNKVFSFCIITSPFEEKLKSFYVQRVNTPVFSVMIPKQVGRLRHEENKFKQ
jgi:hypothetical protein